MPEMYLNATTSAISSFGDAPSWFSVFGIVATATIIVTLFVMALSSFTRYKKLKGKLKWLVDTLGYFFIGIASLGVLAVPSLILYYFGNQAYQGNTAPIEWSIGIIAGYFVIAGIGYIVKKYVYNRIKNFEKKLKIKEKKK